MPGTSYYAEAFAPNGDLCFRMVSHWGEAGPRPCLELAVVWRRAWGVQSTGLNATGVVVWPCLA